MSKKLNVLSLFDGMSCGQIALERAGIKVDNYYASEIDKYAIKVTQDNYPDTIQLGSVVDLDEEYLKTLEIDMLIGGSPCQGFSMAGKHKGSSTKEGIEVTTLKQYLQLREEGVEFDGQSYLFWEFVRIWKATKPKYFFLENVRVTKKWLPMFNEAMGVEPIMINSALVSAQNRVRFYWTNIPNVTQPEDKGIVLKDILLDEVDDKFYLSQKATQYDQSKNGTFLCVDGNGRIDNKKTGCIGARYYKGTEAYGSNPFVLELRPCKSREFNKDSICHHAADATDIKGNESIKRVYADSGKAPTLTTMQGGHREPKVLTNTVSYRKLTPVECERLQTVPDNYTEGVSNSQRYKMLGNGWTIDVVAHIFRGVIYE